MANSPSLAPRNVSRQDPVYKSGYKETSWFLGGTFVITIILWASAFVAIPVALETVEPIPVIMSRLLLSSVFFFPLLIINRAKIKSRWRKDWKEIIAMAACGVTIYLLALTFGQRTVGAGQTSLIINMTPLFTGVMAAFFLKEVFHKRMVYGALISLLGVAFLVLKDGSSLSFDGNNLLILLAAFASSYYYIMIRKLSKHYSAMTLAALTVTIGTAATLPFAWNFISGLDDMSARSGLGILFLGAGSGFIPYIGWAFILSRMEAGKATLYLYFIPVISSLMGWWVLDEAITSNFLFAGALIILGVMIGTGTWRNLLFSNRPRRHTKEGVVCKAP